MTALTVTTSDDEISINLQAVMDLIRAKDLRRAFLDSLRKIESHDSSQSTITIMAGDVTRITTPCLQVLLAMKNKTTEQHIDFLIPEMSDAFQHALKEVGLEGQFINPEQNT
ncbi:MAG: STAS domain-containing protein [Emcibacter sp.]|nr:STAS domain-containing protein [Emcibacter sp.]